MYIWNITELLNLVPDYTDRIKSKLQENQTKIIFFYFEINTMAFMRKKGL